MSVFVQIFVREKVMQKGSLERFRKVVVDNEVKTGIKNNQEIRYIHEVVNSPFQMLL